MEFDWGMFGSLMAGVVALGFYAAAWAGWIDAARIDGHGTDRHGPIDYRELEA